MVDVFEVQADADDRERRCGSGNPELHRSYEPRPSSATRSPVSLRLVGEIHRILMSEVRGGDSARTPGEFRRSQNWIGGSSPGNARFVPPPVDEMNRCLDEWEKSVHNREQIPPLLHIGMLHAQFETIHPFLDGNGRGSASRHVPSHRAGGPRPTPCCTSRSSSRLIRRSTTGDFRQRDVGDWEGWLRFFVDGVARPRSRPPTRFGRSSDCATRTGFGCPDWAGEGRERNAPSRLSLLKAGDHGQDGSRIPRDHPPHGE